MPQPAYDAYSVAISGIHGHFDPARRAHHPPMINSSALPHAMPTRFADKEAWTGGRPCGVQIANPPIAALYVRLCSGGLGVFATQPRYTASEVDYLRSATQRARLLVVILPSQRTGPVAAVAGAAVETMDATGRGTLARFWQPHARHIRAP